jgi:ferredoxin
MAKITFKKDNIVAEAAPGTHLMNICDEKGVNVQFSCRAGSCVSCLITIESGMENLSPPGEVEKMTLEAFGCQPNQRLACQVIVNGDVVIN